MVGLFWTIPLIPFPHPPPLLGAKCQGGGDGDPWSREASPMQFKIANMTFGNLFFDFDLIWFIPFSLWNLLAKISYFFVIPPGSFSKTNGRKTDKRPRKTTKDCERWQKTMKYDQRLWKMMKDHDRPLIMTKEYERPQMTTKDHKRLQKTAKTTKESKRLPKTAKHDNRPQKMANDCERPRMITKYNERCQKTTEDDQR